MLQRGLVALQRGLYHLAVYPYRLTVSDTLELTGREAVRVIYSMVIIYSGSN